MRNSVFEDWMKLSRHWIVPVNVIIHESDKQSLHIKFEGNYTRAPQNDKSTLKLKGTGAELIQRIPSTRSSVATPRLPLDPRDVPPSEGSRGNEGATPRHPLQSAWKAASQHLHAAVNNADLINLARARGASRLGPFILQQKHRAGRKVQ